MLLEFYICSTRVVQPVLHLFLENRLRRPIPVRAEGMEHAPQCLTARSGDGLARGGRPCRMVGRAAHGSCQGVHSEGPVGGRGLQVVLALLQDVLVLAAAGGVLPRNPTHRGCCRQTRHRSPEVTSGRCRCQGLTQRTQVLACAPASRFRPRAGRPSGG